MSRMKAPSVALAAALAGIYLALAVFPIACAFDHGDPMPTGHHHGGMVSHSSFCVWACQVNPTSDAVPSVLVLHPFLVVTIFAESDHTVIAGGAEFHAAARAPPVQS